MCGGRGLKTSDRLKRRVAISHKRGHSFVSIRGPLSPVPTELGLVPATMAMSAAVPSNRTDLLVGAVGLVATIMEAKMAIVKVVARGRRGGC